MRSWITMQIATVTMELRRATQKRTTSALTSPTPGTVNLTQCPTVNWLTRIFILLPFFFCCTKRQPFKHPCILVFFTRNITHCKFPCFAYRGQINSFFLVKCCYRCLFFLPRHTERMCSVAPEEKPLKSISFHWWKQWHKPEHRRGFWSEPIADVAS